MFYLWRMLQPKQKDIILKELWLHFYKWVEDHSTRGLTDILDFKHYDRHIDCWIITVDGRKYANPSIEQLIKLYSKSHEKSG